MIRLLLIIGALSVLCIARQHATLRTQDGGVVQAKVFGKGKRGVVLAHGGPLTKESWTKQAHILTGEGFRVMAIDFRGFGESRVSGQTDSYAPAHNLDVLAAVQYLRKAGAKNGSLVGGSFGGIAAAQVISGTSQSRFGQLLENWDWRQ